MWRWISKQFGEYDYCQEETGETAGTVRLTGLNSRWRWSSTLRTRTQRAGWWGMKQSEAEAKAAVEAYVRDYKPQEF